MRRVGKTLFIFSVLFLLCVAGFAQVKGCTDPRANNYNPTATFNDGSCLYTSTNYKPNIVISNLPAEVVEVSGIILTNNLLWLHNDSGDEPNIYGLDSSTNTIKAKLTLKGLNNTDWEDITRDSLFVYVGDFGNNAGNRKDLKIYKIDKQEFSDTGLKDVNAEIISFSYPDQVNFNPENQNHDFDCEAFISLNDSLYLFSKNWKSEKTKVYRLPKNAGTFVAELIDSFDVKGLVTGAAISTDKNEIYLVGYQSYKPFLFLLFDFKNHLFFSGNKRRIDMPLIQLFQTEGIEYLPSGEVYITSEKTIVSANRLFRAYTNQWTKDITSDLVESQEKTFGISKLYPNPASDELTIEFNGLYKGNLTLVIYDSVGKAVWEKKYSFCKEKELLKVNLPNLKSGNYVITINDSNRVYKDNLMIIK